MDLADLSAEALEEVITTKIAEVDGVEKAGNDSVFEIDNKSLTHRPDLWSHYGFARELSGVLKRPLKSNWDKFADDTEAGAKALKDLKGAGTSRYAVTIAPNSGCRRFIALEIANVKAVESPQWIRDRLTAVGAGVKNLLVDLSNYVMLDIGQPSHAYDADKLNGNAIEVRRAKKGEKFTGLDELEHELTSDDLVIADAKGAVALGGVIGGKNSSVGDSTKRLLLESANFDPTLVRLMAKRHAVRTDASNRFEKSRSAFSAPLAIHRFVQLLIELQPACEIVGAAVDVFLEKPKAVTVPVQFDYIRGRLTDKLTENQIADTLSALGFGVKRENSNKAEVSVPHERATRDINIADDLVEEVGRVYGYQNVPELPPTVKATATRPNPLKEAEYNARDFLVGAGFAEVSGYSFVNEARLADLGFETSDVVQLENPIDVSLSVLRTSLIPGMIEFVDGNARYQEQFALFELGRSYHAKLPKFSQAPQGKRAGFERRLLSLAYVSGRPEASLESSVTPNLKAGADFYAVVDVVKRLARLYGEIELQFRPVVAGNGAAGEYGSLQLWMHPVRAAAVFVGKESKPIGVVAEVRPGLLENTKSRAVIAELDLEILTALLSGDDHFAPISKYPASLFEMSVVMPSRTPYAELESLLRRSASADVLQQLDVLAVYEGKPLKAGEKSVSVKLHLGSKERTLSNEELKSLQDGLIAAVQKSQFSLRA